MDPLHQMQPLLTQHQLFNLHFKLKLVACVLFFRICICCVNLSWFCLWSVFLIAIRSSGLPQAVRLSLQRSRRLRLLSPGRQHEDSHQVQCVDKEDESESDGESQDVNGDGNDQDMIMIDCDQ